MIEFLNKYKAFGAGTLIALILGVILDKMRLININPNHIIENAIFFLFWSFAFSLPIYKFSYLKEKKQTVFKLIGLICFFIGILIIDSSFSIPDNPITFLLMVTFWILATALVSPLFFEKYKYYIIAIYSLILAYFSYVRLFSKSFEVYEANSKESVMLLVFTPIPIFIVVWIYEQWKWMHSLKEGKAKAELDLLKTQINPHFFFNTLNNLYALTVKQSKEAPNVVLKLSEMMRYTIYEGKKEVVAIQDEIEYLQNYIDLHKIRYHKTVSIVFDYEVSQNHEVAPLLFIIPLENAIKHGVETLSDEAYINMSLKSTSDAVEFVIENNFELNEMSEETGIGLENLKRRLALTYPKKHNLSIIEKGNIFRLELTIVLDE